MTFRILLASLWLIGIFPFAAAQSDGAYRNPSEHRDLDGVPLTGFHYGARYMNFPAGTLSLRLRDAAGASYAFTTPFSPSGLPAHSLEITPFGALFNDVFFPPSYAQPTVFASNSYAWYAMRIAYTYQPGGPGSQGAMHLVEIGADFGARYQLNKYLYLGAGVHVAPLSMNYIDLGGIYVPPTQLAQGEVQGFGEMYVNLFQAGTHPFAQAGLCLKRKAPNSNLFSIDLKLTRNVYWVYGSWAGFYFSDDLREAFEADAGFSHKNDLLLNQQPVRRALDLNSWQASLGITFYWW